MLRYILGHGAGYADDIDPGAADADLAGAVSRPLSGARAVPGDCRWLLDRTAGGRGSRAADIEPQHSAVAVVEDFAAAAVEGFVAAAEVVAAEVAVAGAGQTSTSSTM